MDHPVEPDEARQTRHEPRQDRSPRLYVQTGTGTTQGIAHPHRKKPMALPEPERPEKADEQRSHPHGTQKNGLPEADDRTRLQSLGHEYH